jgi:CRISPR-associated protein Csb1
MREAVLNLIALRHLRGDADETTARLQDYVLGLALVCISFPQDYDLRSGCHLVRDGRDAVDAKAVHRDGRQEAFEISHDQALEFAKAAAGRFAFEKTLRVEFDPAKATAYLAERGAKAQGPKKARTSRA